MFVRLKKYCHNFYKMIKDKHFFLSVYLFKYIVFIIDDIIRIREYK